MKLYPTSPKLSKEICYLSNHPNKLVIALLNNKKITLLYYLFCHHNAI